MPDTFVLIMSRRQEKHRVRNAMHYIPWCPADRVEHANVYGRDGGQSSVPIERLMLDKVERKRLPTP